jgi:APA family basic amino acid/polyamine antiporter
MEQIKIDSQTSSLTAPELRRVLGLFSIVGIVIGAMIGSGIFINPAKVAKDVGTPAMMMAVWIVGGILSFFGALAIAELAAIYSQAGGIYIYLREAYGPVVAFIILLSMTGTANGHLLTAPRVFYAMAKDGLFFKSVAKVHPKHRTPHVSIIILATWAALLSLSGTFEQLYSYVIFGFWIFMGLTVAGVIILRRKRPDLPRPYKTWGYPVTPILFILSSVFLTINSLIRTFWNSFAGLALIALGIPVYLVWRSRRKAPAA